MLYNQNEASFHEGWHSFSVHRIPFQLSVTLERLFYNCMKLLHDPLQLSDPFFLLFIKRSYRRRNDVAVRANVIDGHQGAFPVKAVIGV